MADVPGNRGRCAQPCRLSYDLIKECPEAKQVLDNGYLLSPKDLCGLSYLPTLIKNGVTSLKIEGRMKDPEYVATVTRIYRKYIDLAYSGKNYRIEENDKKELLQVFNRGGFSNGHLDPSPNKELIFKQKPHNIGLYLGNISHINTTKGYIILTLNETVSIGDTLSLHNEKYTVSELMEQGKNIKEGQIGAKVTLGRMKGKIKIGDPVYKLASKVLSLSARESFHQNVERIKNPFVATITIKKDTPISLSVNSIDTKNEILKGLSIEISSDVIPEIAKNQPITSDKIIASLSKTTSTPFDFETIHVVLDDGLFIPSIKVINELRRKALEEIEHLALGKIRRKKSSSFSKSLQSMAIEKKETKEKNIASSKKIALLLTILHPEYDYSKLESVDRIYLPLKYFAGKKYKETIKRISDQFDLYIYLPTIMKSNYRNLLVNNIETAIDTYHIKGFVISNLAGFMLKNTLEKNPIYQGKFTYITNYTLNVYNSFSIKELQKLGANTITLSPELNKTALQNLCQNSVPTEILVYGNIPVMSINYCLLGKTNACYPTCGSKCQEESSTYYLKDRLGFAFRLLPDPIQTVTTILNSKITSIAGKDFDCDSYRIHMLDESVEQMNTIIKKVAVGERLEGQDYTNGNLNREV